LDLLLLVAAQGARAVRLSTQPLNRCTDGVLISRERLPDRGVIIDVIGHHRNDRRKIHQCNESGIESLCLRRISKCGPRQIGISRQPGIDIQNFLRIRRCCGDL
jgi:hypothetical protein